MEQKTAKILVKATDSVKLEQLALAYKVRPPEIEIFGDFHKILK